MKWFAIVLAAMGGAGSACAQAAQADAPIYVRSETGELRRNKCKGVYVGNVVATQGEARLASDKLTLLGSRPGGLNADCEPERLIAEANVIYATPKLKISSDRAEYDRDLEIITFTGEVVLTNSDGSVMHGTSLVYNLADERMRIAANNRPVEMIIAPSKRNSSAN